MGTIITLWRWGGWKPNNGTYKAHSTEPSTSKGPSKSTIITLLPGLHLLLTRKAQASWIFPLLHLFNKRTPHLRNWSVLLSYLKPTHTHILDTTLSCNPNNHPSWSLLQPRSQCDNYHLACSTLPALLSNYDCSPNSALNAHALNQSTFLSTIGSRPPSVLRPPLSVVYRADLHDCFLHRLCLAMHSLSQILSLSLYSNYLPASA